MIRTPNGSLGFYGNPAAGHKIDVDAMAINRLAEARRVDPMPDPEKITVGEMIDFITFIARTSLEFPYLLAQPGLASSTIAARRYYRPALGGRSFRIGGTLSIAENPPWMQRRNCLPCWWIDLTLPSEELRIMPLLDAVRLLSQPEADAASPSGTPARLPEGESKADLGRSHYRTPTNAADLVYQNAAALVPTNPWLRDKLKVLTQHASPPPHATETEAPTP